MLDKLRFRERELLQAEVSVRQTDAQKEKKRLQAEVSIRRCLTEAQRERTVSGRSQCQTN